MLDAIDKGDGPTIMGDGSEAFDFVSVVDCARANICAMKSDVVGEYYNVGTGKRTSLRELAEMLIELTGCKQDIQYKPSSAATLVKNRIGSPVKAQNDINFIAQMDLRDGLKELIDWRESHKSEVAVKRAKQVN